MPLPARLTIWLLTLLGRLPLTFMHRCGACLGWLVSFLPVRESKVARQNIAICLPELGASAQRRLLRKSLQETAQSLFELPFLWSRPITDLKTLLVSVEGAELFSDALADARPLIVAAPHLGAWELLNTYLAEHTELLILYRAPRKAWLEQVFNHFRGRSRARPLRAEPAAVRTLLKCLQEGGTLGILPDQQPKQGEGEFADFFGISAFTMTLISRLATRTNAQVLFAYAERLSAGKGFLIHIRAANPKLLGAADLNRNVEACARACLAQYQWSYKRFSMRPAGEPPRY